MRISRLAVPLVLGFALTITGCASTGATDSTSAGEPGAERGGGREAAAAAQEAAFYRLMYDLELTEEQEPVVRGILEDEQAARRALMDEMRSSADPGSGPPVEMMERMEDLARQTEESLRLVLTDEQMDVYQEYVEEQRAAMEARQESGSQRGGGRMGGRGGGGGF